MSNKAKQLSHGGYYLSSVFKEEEEYTDTIYIDKDEPIFVLDRRRTRISGVQRRAVISDKSWAQLDRKISPKHFVLVVRYHYPLVNFPGKLKIELREIELFFGIRQRGEGSVVHEERMIATLSYRLTGDVDVVRNFSNTIKGLLERYGVETLGYQISRT